MAASTREINRSLLPSAKTRATISKRLAGVTGKMTTATVEEMETRYHWFRRLDAEHRSWITLVAQAGIDGFVRWFAAPGPEVPSTSEVFGSAPRELARKISLYQTVELVRTTIEVVESQIDELMPKGDRPVLHAAINEYSREVAFSAAEIYARAAELRGAWDERLEALVVDAVLRGETDETVLSRASTLGWHSTGGVVVVVGPAPQLEPAQALESIRHIAAIAGSDMLGAVQGDRMVVVLGGDRLNPPDRAVEVVRKFVTMFGPGAVILGPTVEHLMDAATSTREAVSAYRAAAGWPEAPRPVTSHDLLPERALSGDGHARRALAHDIYEPLQAAGGGLLETLVTFLDQGLSVEAAARALFVHANTVRYRLRRIHEVTGYSPTDPRDAYALRLAITLGRLFARSRQEEPHPLGDEAKEISGMAASDRAPRRQRFPHAASVGNRAPAASEEGTSERAFCYAKSDDDVGGPPRAMREQQAQKNCREVTIRPRKIRGVPIRPFSRGQEIVQMCLRLWRPVRGRRRQASSGRGLMSPLSLTGSTGCRRCRALI